MIKRIDVGSRMSEVAIFNGVAYFSGQVPDDAEQDIYGQLSQVLSSIDTLLTRVGSDKSRLLMVQIFLADMSDFTALNQVWDAWVLPGHTPPRATVQALLARPEWKVEILVTAAVK